MKNINQLLKLYEIQFTEEELKLVFTHNSFSEHNHSRYVFLGQFHFRGLVCEWIYKHLSGTGTQLHHFLGNILSEKKISRYFDKWRFGNVNIEDPSKIAEQKHIFVYSLLGFICTKAQKKNLDAFILNEFIVPNDQLLPQNYIPKNQWQQLQFLCKQNFDKKPKLKLELMENLNKLSVCLGDEFLSSHQSVSYKYARKKAIQSAYKIILEKIYTHKYSIDTEFRAKEIKTKSEEASEILKAKEEIQIRHLERNRIHSEKMQEKRKLKEIEAKELDKKRKLTKQNLKEKESRKGKNTIYRQYTTDEIAAMSNAKRRNLQDRGIIPKGI